MNLKIEQNNNINIPNIKFESYIYISLNNGTIKHNPIQPKIIKKDPYNVCLKISLFKKRFDNKITNNTSNDYIIIKYLYFN